eukprot:s1946_g14.t1
MQPNNTAAAERRKCNLGTTQRRSSAPAQTYCNNTAAAQRRIGANATYAPRRKLAHKENGKLPNKLIKSGTVWKNHFDENMDFKFFDVNKATRKKITRIVTDWSKPRTINDMARATWRGQCFGGEAQWKLQCLADLIP